MRRALLWLFGLRVLTLREGDVLVYHTDRRLTEHDAKALERAFGRIGELAGRKIPVVVVERGDQLSVMRTKP